MIKETFLASAAFSFRNNLFYQDEFQGFGSFENLYLGIRKKENRLYPDDIVRSLPRIPCGHPLRKEWRRRAFTLRRLIRHLKRDKGKNILEVGCGNGWLCHWLATLPGTEVVGIDINETELLQAARVFGEMRNLAFIYGDILQGLPFRKFDHIILSASLQYFADVPALVRKLHGHLANNGKIHIIDTPLYSSPSVLDAARRSAEYFARLDAGAMNHHYYHHTWDALAAFNLRLMYDPRTLLNRLRQKLAFASPFPWITITRMDVGQLR